uniref:C-type lectin domain-containing protein n=1 Tax=Magallana gigas TaxID=29159 RepID=A0A8W8MZT5_MAGGI
MNHFQEEGFFFGSSLLDWESARIDCERRGMRLVCLKNLTMYEAAKSYLQETLVSLSSDVWIGLRTYSTSPPYIYQHVDNESADFFAWNPNTNEPDNQDVSFCIRLFKTPLTYGTKRCYFEHHFLCEDVPINGNWSEWTTWSACSVTSGDGCQSRFRSCDSPPPSNGGTDCMGLTEFGQHGVNGRTANLRSRSCDSPPPSGGGKDCEGEPEGSEGCDTLVCSSEEYFTCVSFKEDTSVSLGEKIDNITKTLAVNKSILSSEVRKKTCAEDPRPSSKYLGLVAIIFLGMYFILLLLVDFSSFLRWAVEKCGA